MKKEKILKRDLKLGSFELIPDGNNIIKADCGHIAPVSRTFKHNGRIICHSCYRYTLPEAAQ